MGQWVRQYGMGYERLPGATFTRNVQQLFVDFDAAEGYAGPEIVNQFGITSAAGVPVGAQRIFELGDNNFAFPMAPFGTVLAVEPSFNRATFPAVMAAMINAGFATYHACSEYQPYVAKCGLSASGITSATRLTTDGLAANGFVADASTIIQGSGYGTNGQPATTVLDALVRSLMLR